MSLSTSQQSVSSSAKKGERLHCAAEIEPTLIDHGTLTTQQGNFILKIFKSEGKKCYNNTVPHNDVKMIRKHLKAELSVLLLFCDFSPAVQTALTISKLTQQEAGHSFNPGRSFSKAEDGRAGEGGGAAIMEVTAPELL